jgi:hypothetical protein
MGQNYLFVLFLTHLGELFNSQPLQRHCFYVFGR